MKIKYSALVSGARNKLNGSVASRNRYGDYFRNKTTPVNAQTTFQQNVRAILAGNSRMWRGLPQEARDAWTAAAPNRPFTDIFGDKMIYSGFNLFMKVNQQLNVFNQPALQLPPPSEPAPADIQSVSVAEAAGVVTVTPGVAPPSSTQLLAIYAVANVSQGKSFVKNLYKFLIVVPLTQDPVDITAALQNRFGQLVPGTKIAVRAATFAPESALLGQPYAATTVAS